eukprot:scaffold114820_cov55-Prasinocladus_malaysianus.AAC.1
MMLHDTKRVEFSEAVQNEVVYDAVDPSPFHEGAGVTAGSNEEVRANHIKRQCLFNRPLLQIVNGVKGGKIKIIGITSMFLPS